MSNSIATTTAEALSVEQQIKGRIAELQEAIEKSIPGYQQILKEIHTNLRNDPDTVTLLSDEEIGVIVAGLSKHKNVVIALEEAKKASKSKNVTASGKKLTQITGDDI